MVDPPIAYFTILASTSPLPVIYYLKILSHKINSSSYTTGVGDSLL